LNLSEKIFEQYCRIVGLRFNRVCEEQGKTPDYELTIGSQLIIVEVKEFFRNKQEQESDRLLQQRGYGNVLSCTPGQRVRKKIAESSAQIKARSKGVYPSMLVLFDRGKVAGHLDPYHIRAAMYGLEQIHLVLRPLHEASAPYFAGTSFGPKRKMTESDNTSISAIGVLYTPGPDEIGLHVYHNKYAAIPLDFNLLRNCATAQFELASEVVDGRIPSWKEVALR
jgi:hypothetical protein